MRNTAHPTPSVIPAEKGFIITVGCSERHYEHDCARALRKLQAAGFQAGPASPESMRIAADIIEERQALEDND